MPTPLETLVTRIREALAVDSSYEATIIPFGVERAATRLLRDYHFPWAISRQIYTALAVGQQDYALPAGFKKELAVRFYTTSDQTYSDPLLKREGFVLPHSDGIPRYYWMWNGNLSTDIKLDPGNVGVTNLVLWYENMGWAANQTWMLDRFSDILFSATVFRLAAELQKKEVAEIFGALWADDRVALAKYTNELEFDNGEYVQREAQEINRDRYPAY